MDQLDKTDLKILSILQGDGRITNARLAEELGLSPSSTLERVKKLEQSGVIQKYVALVDRQKLNLGTVAYVSVRIDWVQDNVLQDFHNQIIKMPEVLECYSIAGEFDYLLKVVVADLDQYNAFLHEKLSRAVGIRTIRTSFVLSVHKQETAFPA